MPFPVSIFAPIIHCAKSPIIIANFIMKTKLNQNFFRFFLVLTALPFFCAATPASARSIESEARSAYQALLGNTPAARALAPKAKAVLVFPKIVKGGFVVGANFGNGVLFVNGRSKGRYNTVAGSYGLQAGIQTFGYALFLMTDDAVSYLDRSGGWEIGAGPSIVIVDEGVAKNITSTTLRSGVYAFIFNQKGLMAGIGLQGSKITRIR